MLKSARNRYKLQIIHTRRACVNADINYRISWEVIYYINAKASI